MSGAIRRSTALGLTLLLLPTTALAHPGVAAGGSGFVAGLLHPLGGPDHVLAMLAMGLWSAQLGGRARWLLPLLFLAEMAAGAGAGMLAFSAAPGATLEIALIGSAIALGGLVAARCSPGRGVAAGMGALVAVLHGYAHGLEVPDPSTALGYGAGFLATTAALQGIGVALGVALSQRRSGALLRLGGATLAAAGLAAGWIGFIG